MENSGMDRNVLNATYLTSLIMIPISVKPVPLDKTMMLINENVWFVHLAMLSTLPSSLVCFLHHQHHQHHQHLQHLHQQQQQLLQNQLYHQHQALQHQLVNLAKTDNSGMGKSVLTVSYPTSGTMTL